VNTLEQTAAVWAALQKISGKELCRDGLPGGSQYDLKLELRVTVDGLAWSRRMTALLVVGHESLRVTSATPNAAKLLACILGRLNRQTREKLLRELPEAFAEAGNKLPEVDRVLLDASESFLKRLRAKVSQTAKGLVSCQYKLIEI